MNSETASIVDEERGGRNGRRNVDGDRPSALVDRRENETVLVPIKQWSSNGGSKSVEPDCAAAIATREDGTQNARLECVNHSLLVGASEDADEGGDVGEVEEDGNLEEDIGGEELKKEHCGCINLMGGSMEARAFDGWKFLERSAMRSKQTMEARRVTKFWAGP